MQIVQCNDDTCRYNQDHYCRCQFPMIEVGQDYTQKTVNICTSYEDKRNAERIENRMVVDHEWNFLSRQYAEVQEVLSEPGYMQFGSNLFVPEKEAYDYALAQCLYGSEEDQKEFKEMLVDWFYSGGDWRREEKWESDY